jgi:hypothetical protein
MTLSISRLSSGTPYHIKIANAHHQEESSRTEHGRISEHIRPTLDVWHRLEEKKYLKNVRY